MLFNIILVIVLVICVITDVRKRLIYNKVIFPALILSFSLHFIISGLSGFGVSFLGFLTGYGILLIPYFMGGMGAGDVKLLALVGALKGPAFVLNTSIYMALLGGVLALGILVFSGGAFKRLKYYFHWLYGKKNGLKVPLALTKDSMKATYPYGVAIAGGAILSFVGKAWIS
ncbi:A24 family peptidase [Pseudalkalibacillus salsuginis]|uniref:A24 family peptidase n=1 Tax=Pseudalkalibacillus salsuginis TaxID=2910972 RepID=UPI001F16847E|nr:prepilin peptidase [Pseudalkalibacillus salsuginis]MCF6411250.1 prepilin peptidase [Pseudalkalibacillus salsuginis]